MHVVVTGGSGFIGTRLVEALCTLGHRVGVVDPVPCAVQGIELHRRSVLDPGDVQEVIQGADAVIHLAGPVRDGVRRDPHGAATLQLQGTLNVLDACQLKHVPHFLLASSFYVYHGLPAPGMVDEQMALDPLKMDLFGSIKLMSEALCREYTRKYGLAHTILRLGSAYGPGGSNVIRTFLETGLQGKTLEVWGEGKRQNQYTFVDDLVNGIVAALDTFNETFNLCSLEVTTTACLAEMLEREFGFTVYFERTRPEEASIPVADPRKAMDRLNWRPISLREGLHMTFRELTGDHGRMLPTGSK
jgi:nucleoside-diphosphate-sugar epimerase